MEFFVKYFIKLIKPSFEPFKNYNPLIISSVLKKKQIILINIYKLQFTRYKL